tara:strand:+ start:1096 stop:3033 length:1938 start_codon:yes stop_codon:yes gene_type:complete
MSVFSEVTDPEVLARLNFGGVDVEAVTGEVTDPEVLARLNFGDGTEETVIDSSAPLANNPETWADWIAPVLEVGSALAVAGPAAAQGAGYGFALAGPPGAVVGGLAAGVTASAAAVFASKFAGENAEALIEGREFNPDLALQEALDAAQTDAIATTILGIAIPSAKVAWGAGKELTGKAALDPKQVETIVELQKKLKDYGSSLLPSMVNPQGKTAGFITSIANASQVTKQTVNNYIDGYGVYMGKQVEELVSTLSAGTPKEQGRAVQALVGQTDQALRELVDPLYKAVEKLGRKVIVESSEQAKAAARKIKIDNFRATTVNKQGEEITTFNYPNSGVAADIKYLEQLPNDLTFYEAHKRLSLVKKNLHDVTGGANVDSNRALVLGETVDVLTKAMDKAAETNPVLKAKYKEVTDFYKRGKDVVSSTWLEKALKVDDPTKIGAMLTQTGNTVGIQEIKKLKKLAAEYQASLGKGTKIKGLSEDPMVGIRKGFLEATLRSGEKDSIASFKALRNKLADPKYKETFDELFKGSAAAKKINTILDELSILERAESLGSGFQLSVASGEIGAARNPSIMNLIKSGMPAFVANRQIKPESVDKVISMLKTVNAAEAKGVTLPPQFATELGSAMFGVKAGVVTAAVINNSQE